MLIRPHDGAVDDDEWRQLVADHPFGTLIAPGTNRDLPVVPTHVHFDGADTIRLHLAKPDPVWCALRDNPRCLFVVVAAARTSPPRGRHRRARRRMGHPHVARRDGPTRLHRHHLRDPA